MIQQHRLELIFAGPSEHVCEVMPVAKAAMQGPAGRLHPDATDLNNLAHKFSAMAELNWEDRNQVYNILPHESGFRVTLTQAHQPFSQDAMARIRAHCQQIFCGPGRWRARIIGFEIIVRLPPAPVGAENQPAPASASATKEKHHEL